VDEDDDGMLCDFSLLVYGKTFHICYYISVGEGCGYSLLRNEY
jgi:hypothetical protein